MPYADPAKRREYQKLYRKQHGEEYKVYSRRYYQRNVGMIAVSSEEYRKKNPLMYRVAAAKWREKNPEKRRVVAKSWRERHQRDYQKSRMNEPEFKITRNLRNRIWCALKGTIKSARTLELLGMDLKEFRVYIQGQFRPGMTWENYGPVWHIDHVRPCASFDLTNPEEQKVCFRWDNIQPLFAAENLRKNCRYA